MVMLAALVLLTAQLVQMAPLVPPARQEATTLEVPVLHARVLMQIGLLALMPQLL